MPVLFDSSDLHKSASAASVAFHSSSLLPLGAKKNREHLAPAVFQIPSLF